MTHTILKIKLCIFIASLPLYAGVNQWTPIGPDGADCIQLVRAPSNPIVLYALCQQAVVYISRDEGLHWKMIRELGDNWTSTNGKILIDPSDAEILYLLLSGELSKTTDGGEHWEKKSFCLNGSCSYFMSILLDPRNPQTVYASTGNSLLKSLNGGDSWSVISTDNSFFSFAFVSHHPTKEEIWGFSSSYPADKVLKSTDGGGHWATLTDLNFRFGQLAFLEISSRLPDSVYVGGDGGIWISRDGGGSWRNVQPTDSTERILWMSFDPIQTSTCYAGGSSGKIFRSQDQGDHWEPLDFGLPRFTIVGSRFSPDPSAPGVFLAGVNGSGVIRLQEAGASWQPFNQGMRHAMVRSLLFCRENPGMLLVAVEGQDVLGWNLSLNQWERLSQGIDTEIYTLQQEPSAPTIFAGGGGAVFQSSDQGVSWKKSALRPEDPTGNTVVAFAFSHTDPNLIDACSNYAMYQTHDHGESWQQLSGGCANSHLVSDPLEGEVLYLLVNPNEKNQTTLYRSNDFGKTWFGAGSEVRSMAFSPLNPQILYMIEQPPGSSEQSLIRTGPDGEFTSSGWSFGTLNSLQVSPFSNDRLFLAADTVFQSRDGGRSWTSADAGLDGPSATTFAFDPTDPNHLFAASDRGVFEITFRENSPSSMEVTSPAGGEAWFSWSLGEPQTETIRWRNTGFASTVKIEFSINGGLTYSLIASGVRNVGSYKWTIPDLGSTSCLIRVTEERPNGVSGMNSAVFTINNSNLRVEPAPLHVPARGGVVQAELKCQGSCSERKWQLFLYGGERYVQLGEPLDGVGPGILHLLLQENGEIYQRDSSVQVLDELTGHLLAQFQVLQDAPSRIIVPSVLSTAGVNGSFFTTDLTLTNLGRWPADMNIKYFGAPSLGGGRASFTLSLPPGQQTFIPDAIAWLKSQSTGQVPDGNVGGSLQITCSSLEYMGDLVVAARTTTPAPQGRYGVAYLGQQKEKALWGYYVGGFRQDEQERSNLALINLGDENESSTTFNVEVYDEEGVLAKTLGGQLAPGEFFQYSKILQTEGLNLQKGSVWVHSLFFTEISPPPIYIYGVVNDQVTSDGSILPPSNPLNYSPSTPGGWWLPVIVSNSRFNTELTLLNTNASPTPLDFELVLRSGSLPAPDHTVRLPISLGPRKQLIIPDLIKYLRQQGVIELGPEGNDLVGSLELAGWNIRDLYAVARVLTVGTPEKGRYGVAFTARPSSSGERWLTPLRQDDEVRSNLALVNCSSNPITLALEFYDGTTGAKVNTIDASLGSYEWRQLNQVLSAYAPGTRLGYIRIFPRTETPEGYLAYGVINDGSYPGLGTSDGAFIELTEK